MNGFGLCPRLLMDFDILTSLVCLLSIKVLGALNASNYVYTSQGIMYMAYVDSQPF